MSDDRLQIRNATSADLPALARFGVELARLHGSFDAERFAVSELGETDFVEFFGEQLAREDAALLVAEQDGTVVGYAFVRMEGPSLEDLRGAGAWLHDIYIDPEARGHSIGRQLVQAAIDAARALGSDSLMLGVSPQNERGRRLFDDMGLRPTMVEMRMELDQSDS